jgi:hypothetical protein
MPPAPDGANDGESSTLTGAARLTPALALDYVRELSADVRAAVLLNAAGEGLAGPAQLSDHARALLDAGPGSDELEVGTADGVVCAVRSTSHAAIAVCGRFAIGAVVREDLRTALSALEGRSRPEPLQSRESTSDDSLIAAAAALISAAERGFEA